jgi:adenosylcobinamide-GDP ribazoletransferase
VRRLVVAIAFMTRLPVPGPPPVDAAEVGRAAPFFPLAGALVGGLLALLAWLASPRLPPMVCAALLVGVLALLTGALHLDGLADMADGFGGGRSREDVLRIMRDHAIGSYGASALVLVLILKVATVAALLTAGIAARWLVIAPVVARWTPVALASCLPYARVEGGLGAAVTDHRSRGSLAVATALAAAVALGLAGWRGAIALTSVALFAALHGLACRRRIGGVTGDTLGAGVEVAEVLVLFVAVAMKT